MSQTAPLRIPRRVAPGVVPAGSPALPRPDTDTRHLRLVDPVGRRREVRRRWLVRIWAAGIVSAALLGVVVHALMAEAQMRVARMERRMAIERSRYEAVRLDVARGETPAAVVARATKLGFVPAPNIRTVEVPAPARAAADGDAAVESKSSSSTAPWETVKPNLESLP